MNEEELKKALNQKLCDIADILMEYYNCCDIHESENGLSCRVGDPSPCCFHTIFGKGLCPFSKDWKCHNRNCDCKLWICNTAVESSNPMCVEGLMLLEKFGKLFGIVRDPLIGKPYVGADRPPK